jgi:hypothetical protein
MSLATSEIMQALGNELCDVSVTSICALEHTLKNGNGGDAALQREAVAWIAAAPRETSTADHGKLIGVAARRS